ncbi:MAG: hypothetical protein JWN76_14 [Chitinophagaceae bacterium]|nr:hypothetical protein [Chitinophagaceae bacterium]
MLTFAGYAQLQDADAFFSGGYNKKYVKDNGIKQIAVDIFIGGSLSSFYLLEFDKNGFLKKQTILDSMRHKVSDYFFKYNQYGDQIERTEVDYDLNKTYKTSFSKAYMSGHLVSEKSSELPLLTKYSYNSKGQKIQAITIFASGTTSSETRISYYTYNRAGKLQSTKEAILNPDGTSHVIQTTTFSYDPNGNIVSVIRDHAPTWFIRYDKKGFLKSKKIKMSEDPGGFEMIDNYHYTLWK